MFSLRNSLVLFTLVLISSLSMAAPVNQETVDKLLVLSGLETQFKDTAASTQMMLSQTPLPGAKSEKLKKFLATATDYNALTDNVSKTIKADLSQEEAQELISFYEGNFGNRIARAEELGTSPEAMQSAMQNAQTLMADPKRIEMANKVMAEMNSLEEAIDVQKALSTSMMAAMSLMQAPDQKIDLGMIENMIGAQMEAAGAQMEPQLRLMILNIYQDFSLEEMEEYLSVLQTPSMKKLNTLVLQGSLDAIGDATNILVAE